MQGQLDTRKAVATLLLSKPSEFLHRIYSKDNRLQYCGIRRCAAAECMVFDIPLLLMQ
jgi:hypothetical protein